MRFVVGAVAGAATFAMGAKVYGRRPSMSTDEVTPEWRKYRAVAALRVEGEDYIMRAGRFVANAIGMGLGALILRVQNSCETEVRARAYRRGAGRRITCRSPPRAHPAHPAMPAAGSRPSDQRHRESAVGDAAAHCLQPQHGGG